MFQTPAPRGSSPDCTGIFTSHSLSACASSDYSSCSKHFFCSYGNIIAKLSRFVNFLPPMNMSDLNTPDEQTCPKPVQTRLMPAVPPAGTRPPDGSAPGGRAAKPGTRAAVWEGAPRSKTDSGRRRGCLGHGPSPFPEQGHCLLLGQIGFSGQIRDTVNQERPTQPCW